MNLISIIIPTKNRNIFLNNAVKSVLQQTYTNWELLIINDYGKEIKLNYTDIRIKIINNKYTKGGNGARNTGITLSKGQFITFLDDDDEWKKEKLIKQIEIMQNSNAILCYTGKNIFYKGAKFNTNKYSFKKEILSPILTLKFHNYIGTTSSIMVRANILKESQNRFDESIHILQDYDFYLHLCKLGKFIGIKDDLVIYNYNPNRKHVSLNFDELYNSIKKIIIKQKGIKKILILPGLIFICFQKLYNYHKYKINQLI